MAFRATNIIPSTAYRQAKSTATRLKADCQRISLEFASGADSGVVLRALELFKSFRRELNDIKATPGIGDYAKGKGQENDPTYDAAAEFTTLLSLLDVAIGSIVSGVPKDSNSYLLIETMDAAGVRTDRNFSGAALSGIRADIDAVAAGIS